MEKNSHGRINTFWRLDPQKPILCLTKDGEPFNVIGIGDVEGNSSSVVGVDHNNQLAHRSLDSVGPVLDETYMVPTGEFLLSLVTRLRNRGYSIPGAHVTTSTR